MDKSWLLPRFFRFFLNIINCYSLSWVIVWGSEGEALFPFYKSRIERDKSVESSLNPMCNKHSREEEFPFSLKGY